MAQPQVLSASQQNQAPQRTQPELSARSRSSPPSQSYQARPQRKRSTVPMTRRFRHSVPWLSSVSRCLGPTQRRDPVSSSIGGQPPAADRSLQGPLRHLVIFVSSAIPPSFLPSAIGERCLRRLARLPIV